MTYIFDYIDDGCYDDPSGGGRICREYFANIAFLNKRKVL